MRATVRDEFLRPAVGNLAPAKRATMKRALLRRLERIEQHLCSTQSGPGQLAILEQMDPSRRQALAPGDRVVIDWVETLQREWWGRERILAGLAEPESTCLSGRAMGPPNGHPKISVRCAQATVISCDKRFRVLVAGRRFGKTELALIELLRAVRRPDRVAWYVAPTYKQAKHIAWKRLKALVRPYQPLRIYETDLRIEFPWQATIALRGADNYDSLRGEGLDFMVLDEYASMAREVWSEVLRPMLADRRGAALFIGTPHGFNHFYDLYSNAQQSTDWAAFHFTTEQGGNVSAEELQSAQREMDPRTYRQEFQASFENLGEGRVYYSFGRSTNVQSLQFQRGQPAFWSLDFNVHPMCAVLGQVLHDGTVHVLDEIVLDDANTPAACQAFLQRVEDWRLDPPHALWLCGDATGDHRHSSASRTDWQIVRDFLRAYNWRFAVSDRVPSENPSVKDRTNCLNALLENHLGQHRLLIDPRCRELIRDLEQVVWKADGHGNRGRELDKSDWRRTHASDALGYLIAQQFPMQASAGFRARSLL
jgi:Terminase large subunit, T4likevirus-type, N-terminal